MTDATLRSIVSLATGVVLLALGLAFVGLGGWLIVLGGTWYYALAGLGLCASGVLIILRRGEALWVYATTCVGTLIWALSEVGLDGWQLMPRLVAPALLGIWISLPFVGGRLRRFPWRECPLGSAWSAAIVYLLIALGVIGLGYRNSAVAFKHPGVVPAASAAAVNADAENDWRHYGRAVDGQRYSPLSQINVRIRPRPPTVASRFE